MRIIGNEILIKQLIDVLESLPFWNVRHGNSTTSWNTDCSPVSLMGEIPQYLLGKENVRSMYNLKCIAIRNLEDNWFYQDINLPALGISGNVMDQLQPIITVQTW